MRYSLRQGLRYSIENLRDLLELLYCVVAFKQRPRQRRLTDSPLQGYDNQIPSNNGLASLSGLVFIINYMFMTASGRCDAINEHGLRQGPKKPVSARKEDVDESSTAIVLEGFERGMTPGPGGGISRS
jgi:hypothetical protein